MLNIYAVNITINKNVPSFNQTQTVSNTKVKFHFKVAVPRLFNKDLNKYIPSLIQPMPAS